MINNELLEYIKHQLKNDVSRDIITGALKVNGWTDADVNEAFVAIMPPVVPVEIKPVVPNVTPIINPIMSQVQSPFVTQVLPLEQSMRQSMVQPASPIINPVTSPFSTQQPAIHKSNGKKILATIIILILLGIGGGFYFYKTQTINPKVLNFFGLIQNNINQNLNVLK